MSDGLQIPTDIRNLPIADRVELATRIWESIAEDNAKICFTEEHQRILDERIREADEDSKSLIPAEEVFRDLAGGQ